MFKIISSPKKNQHLKGHKLRFSEAQKLKNISMEKHMFPHKYACTQLNMLSILSLDKPIITFSKFSSSFRIDSFSLLIFSQFVFSELIWQVFVSFSTEFDLISEENLTLTAAEVFSGISNSASLKD